MLIWPAVLLFAATSFIHQEPPASIQIVPQKRFLLLPVKNGAPKHWVKVSSPSGIIDDFEIETAEGKPDWWAFLDLSAYKGQDVAIESDASQGVWLASLKQSNETPSDGPKYDEAMRPQLHFTSLRGWLNDPNGLLFYKGKYHLFYQHNPYGWGWGNMHWGHAVSTDLIHWKELPAAVYPDALGTIFSGSGLVDRHNTSGFGSAAANPPMVLMYTAAGGTNPESKGQPFTQCLAYSTDEGTTWTKYSANPVLGALADGNRDPKVIWHAPTKHWIVALYLSDDHFALFRSTDLKSWEKTCDVQIPGDGECPNFFEIPVAGRPGETKWVFFGAQGKYRIGSFDGEKFTPETDPIPLNHGDGYYAAQVYTDLPKGRRVLVSWARQDLPGMPFNQKLGLPVDLTLRPTSNGLRLFANPIPEVSSLVKGRSEGPVGECGPLKPLVFDGHGELIDTNLAVQVGDAKLVTFTVRGIAITYNAEKRLLTCGGSSASVEPVDGVLRLRAIVDRTSIDLYANEGEVYMPVNAIPVSGGLISVSSEGGVAHVNSWTIKELRSIWPKVEG